MRLILLITYHGEILTMNVRCDVMHGCVIFGVSVMGVFSLVMGMCRVGMVSSGLSWLLRECDRWFLRLTSDVEFVS